MNNAHKKIYKTILCQKSTSKKAMLLKILTSLKYPQMDGLPFKVSETYSN